MARTFVLLALAVSCLSFDHCRAAQSAVGQTDGVDVLTQFKLVDSLLLNASGQSLREKLEASLGSEQGKKVVLGLWMEPSCTSKGDFTWTPKNVRGGDTVRIYIPILVSARVTANLDGKTVWAPEKKNGSKVLSPEIEVPPSADGKTDPILTVQVENTGTFGMRGGVDDIYVLGPAQPKDVKAAQNSVYRTWIARDGRKVEAAFVRFEDGVLTIRRKSDGKTFSIRLDQLAPEDVDWVTAKSGRKAPASEPPVASLPKGWPPYSGELVGSNEVRIKNPNGFDVRVGLRATGKGRDFVVPASGTRSVQVGDGKYDVYFVYSSDPNDIYQGDSFTLAGNGVEIQIVKVVDGNYGIRKIN